MAKKTKRAVARKKKTYNMRSEADEGPAPEQRTEEVVEHSPGKPRVMVTWHGSGGEQRPGPKTWYGMQFEQGKPTSVEHSPFWDAMRKDIDASRTGDWTYEHVVEHEEPPPVEPPPPEPEPDPEARRR